MEPLSHLIAWLQGATVSFWQLVRSHPQTTAGVVSAMAAVLALLHAARSVRQSVANLHYTELDSIYLDLLKLAIDRPYLRQPDAIYRNPLAKTHQEREYDVYARMIWTFLETVADRCDKDKSLSDTWYPVIQDEGVVHRDWIRQEPMGFSVNFYRRFGPDGPFGDRFLTRKI
ncbi:MAG: hypothetical protein ACOY6E_03485 [Pseudomonadota bacterium]